MKVETTQRRPSRDIPRHSHGLWSLWDIMHTFPAADLFLVCRTMTLWSDSDKTTEAFGNAERRNRNRKALGSHEETLVAIGFNASIATSKKMRASLKKEACTHSELKALAKEFLGRLIDEAEAQEFFALTPREAEYFKLPFRGWEICTKRFPKITGDVEEASKCFALSRYAAAVFHSLQVVETGLVELGTFLKVTDPHSGWTAVSAALRKVIDKKHQERTKFEKNNFAFLEQVQGTVEGLKNAWRNKISHAHGKLTLMTTDFNPEVAEEILFATRAFTRRVAEGLPAPKEKKTKASQAEASEG